MKFLLSQKKSRVNQAALEGTVADILDSAQTEKSNDYAEPLLRAREESSIKRPKHARHRTTLPTVRHPSDESPHGQNDFEVPSVYQTTKKKMIEKIVRKDNIMDRVNSSNTKTKIKEPNPMSANATKSFEKRSKSVVHHPELPKVEKEEAPAEPRNLKIETKLMHESPSKSYITYNPATRSPSITEPNSASTSPRSATL